MSKAILPFIFSSLCLSLVSHAQTNPPSRNPLFFIDSVSIDKDELKDHQPSDIASISVYKDSSAIRLLGPKGKDGVVFIETKKFARKRYWNFFSTKSSAYLNAIPTLESDSLAVYILNGKILKHNFEGDLAGINDDTFINLEVISKERLMKDYSIANKSYGIVVNTRPRNKKN